MRRCAGDSCLYNAKKAGAKAPAIIFRYLQKNITINFYSFQGSVPQKAGIMAAHPTTIVRKIISMGAQGPPYSAVDRYSMEIMLSSCRMKHSFMPSLA